MPTRKLIYEGWMQYSEHVVPKDAPLNQKIETKQAFYAGAAHLWSSFMANLDHSSPDETPTDLSLAEGVQKEIDKFLEDVKRRGR